MREMKRRNRKNYMLTRSANDSCQRCLLFTLVAVCIYTHVHNIITNTYIKKYTVAHIYLHSQVHSTTTHTEDTLSFSVFRQLYYFPSSPSAE